MKIGRGLELLDGFHYVEAGTRIDTTIAGIRFAGTENKINARQIDWSSPALRPQWTLIRADFATFRQLQGHLYVTDRLAVINFFGGDSITAVRQCGAHVILVVPGTDISSVERTSKKKMLGGGLKHSTIGFTLEQPDRSARLHFALTTLGEDEDVSNQLLSLANAAHGTTYSWPDQAGSHTIRFAEVR